jgi:hypothetical protein
VKPVVEVRDKNDLPVAGAVVTFTIAGLQGGGNAAVFANGQTVFAVVTDAAGRAAAAELQPLVKGAVQIQVQASYQGQIATTTITQTNFATTAEAQAAKSSNGSQSQSNTQNVQQQLNAGNTGSAGANGAANAAGQGMSTMAKVGLWSGVGVGGAVGAQKIAEQLKDCSMYEEPLNSALNNMTNVCYSYYSTERQCTQAGQQVFDVLGDLCSCNGPSGSSEVEAQFGQLRSMMREAGLSLPSSCR